MRDYCHKTALEQRTLLEIRVIDGHYQLIESQWSVLAPLLLGIGRAGKDLLTFCRNRAVASAQRVPLAGFAAGLNTLLDSTTVQT